MNTPDLWRRSRELTEEIAALEATGTLLGFRLAVVPLEAAE